MKKMRGFTSFEFYFVMSVISIIILVAAQRYFQLAEETKRLSFEVIAKNFNAAVYNHHARWIVAQQQTKAFQLNVDVLKIQFTPQGWPVAIAAGEPLSPEVSAASCLSLWNNLLESPPAISYEGSEAHGSRAFHLSVVNEGTCRYELATDPSGEFYFDYLPFSGQVLLRAPPTKK